MNGWRFPFGESVAVLRAARVTDPFSGEDTHLDWDTPTVLPVDVPCPVYPSTVAQSKDLDTPLLVVATLTCLVPYGTDVTEMDRLRVSSGPYAQDYDIRAVRPWKNPMVGWEAGTELTLEWGDNRG